MVREICTLMVKWMHHTIRSDDVEGEIKNAEPSHMKEAPSTSLVAPQTDDVSTSGAVTPHTTLPARQEPTSSAANATQISARTNGIVEQPCSADVPATTSKE